MRARAKAHQNELTDTGRTELVEELEGGVDALLGVGDAVAAVIPRAAGARAHKHRSRTRVSADLSPELPVPRTHACLDSPVQGGDAERVVASPAEGVPPDDREAAPVGHGLAQDHLRARGGTAHIVSLGSCPGYFVCLRLCAA